MKVLLYSAPAALAGAVGAYQPEWIPVIVLFFLYVIFKSPGLLCILTSLCISFFFFLHTNHHLNTLTTNMSADTKTLTLEITSPFTGSTNLRAEAIHQEEKLIIMIPQEQKSLIERLPDASQCQWTGELIQPSSAENFHAFDYRSYLYYQNIHWIFRAESVKNCVMTDQSVLDKLNMIRHKGIERTEQIFPQNSLGIANALLFGDRSKMEDEQIRMYQRLGVIHLLAISGMHVGMMTLLIWLTGLRIGLTKETVRMGMFIILPLYTIMAGAAPPVLRAAGMVLLGLCLQYLFIRLPLVHILCTVFIIHLFLFPLELIQAGFQLSYAVSFALACSSGLILRLKHKSVSLLIVTAIAQLSALPIILWHFYELSLSSFIVNMFYVPLYTIIILPAFVLLYLLSFLSMDAAVLLAYLPSIIIHHTENISAVISDIRFSVLITGKPGLFNTVILLIFCYLILFFSERRKRFLSTISAMVLVVTMTAAPYISSRGSITFINVGQGDSVLIQLPYKQGNILIDTGGQVQFGKADSDYSVGQNIVLPYLKSMGVSKIDLMILTHHDWDHIGGAADLARELYISEVWTSAGSTEKKEMKELLHTFQAQQTPVREISETVSWQSGDAEFTLLVPGENYEGNDASLILTAEAGGKKWLFTGDIGESTENALMNQFEDIDVLKVAHHGSNSSTIQAFLDRVKPETAIISAGKNNMYGHPHPDVLERLHSAGSRIYITADHGAVRYIFEGNQGTFEQAVPYDNKK
ncbi:DNA internalization-related competence protein ComEC/Rec2 [Jeotgalibacillus terrae]|uniref:DNA internalization-related competence protein ComEC/Rec2 n=1 Tax=Jeotgalibacillus terrae TaxID=587735 RepID=A0ABW5ZKG3_9BACL|nr:DNA internalization-related competence protein ComEC/Rec2 [Jeotgalibacillus terrae]MBM7577714.1 competence protein ComEC [Jeotgalibacillus terrae]